MAIQPHEIDATRNHITAAIDAAPGQLSPADLIDNLRDAGVNEDHVRLVMWFLLDQRWIALDAGWNLVMADGAS